MSNTLTELPRLDALFHRLEAYRTRYWDTNFNSLVARVRKVKTSSFQIPGKKLWRTYEASVSNGFLTYAAGIDDKGPEVHPEIAHAIHQFELRINQLDTVRFELRGRIAGIIRAEFDRRGRTVCIEVNGRRYIQNSGECVLFGAKIDEDVVKL